jgi:GT2 family glycosyltransferase
MPKISIVSAYYNRKKSLLRTLKTVEKSSFKDFEFIIVDDASDSSQRIEDFAEEFSFVKLVRIDPKNKHHINPCIPFNLGFSLVRGDVVIIQAPECLHLGDVLDFVANNYKDNQYLVFSCYGLGNVLSNKLDSTDFTEQSISSVVGDFLPRSTTDVGKNDAWIIHPVYRSEHYNFLTAITTKDLRDLGGFDERFADGYAFDDTEFASRISKKKMDIKFVEKPICIHQFHRSTELGMPNIRTKEAKNRALYNECLKSDHYKVQNSFLEGRNI